MTADTVLVVGCTSASAHGQDQMRRLAAQAAARGLRVLGVDTPAALAGGIWRMAADEVRPLDYSDEEACRRFAAARPEAAAVLTLKEGAVLAAARLARALGLPGNALEAVRTIRTKDLCRDALRNAGFTQPRSTVAADLREAERFLAESGGNGPWIVKPRDGMGSAGVSLVRSAHDLPAALDALGGVRPFLVEEFVHGEEFSAEGVMLGGVCRILGLTRKRTGAGFVETGHRMPAGLDATIDELARAETARAVAATGISHGIVHVEFWTTPEGGIVLGEIHARPGGDFLHALVEHTRPGLELFGALLDDLLGRPAAAIPPETGAAGSDFLVLAPGRVAAVEGWGMLSRSSGLLAAHLGVWPGDILGPVTSSADRHGVLVAGADGTEGVETVLAEARGRLSIVMETAR
ncbi:ATP-grasp domain-containing protein [Streptomyces parvus]|uniref:ATP-grasp domain-containing protein n=1 Tax=Streptomyces parvus TaxID=66428 RepID=UPI00381A2808